jgi:hypothetical protein
MNSLLLIALLDIFCILLFLVAALANFSSLQALARYISIMLLLVAALADFAEDIVEPDEVEIQEEPDDVETGMLTTQSVPLLSSLDDEEEESSGEEDEDRGTYLPPVRSKCLSPLLALQDDEAKIRAQLLLDQSIFLKESWSQAAALGELKRGLVAVEADSYPLLALQDDEAKIRAQLPADQSMCLSTFAATSASRRSSLVSEEEEEEEETGKHLSPVVSLKRPPSDEAMSSGSSACSTAASRNAAARSNASSVEAPTAGRPKREAQTFPVASEAVLSDEEKAHAGDSCSQKQDDSWSQSSKGSSSSCGSSSTKGPQDSIAGHASWPANDIESQAYGNASPRERTDWRQIAWQLLRLPWGTRREAMPVVEVVFQDQTAKVSNCYRIESLHQSFVGRTQ